MFKQYGIDIAIEKLRPGAKYSLENFEITAWDDPEGREQPTKKELLDQVEKDKKDYEYHMYQMMRFKEYPEGYMQLDMLWHDMNNDVIPGKNGVWYNEIKKVKEKYPKPIEPLELD